MITGFSARAPGDGSLLFSVLVVFVVVVDHPVDLLQV
jgi:hypothetical protein